ncbi:hypothetical protein PENANT_c022G05831 [Penicillium antarcticum]|uniref:Uncharacterized protein n=1 Tax=Penicillium antarcticum TaxID=416450 RepID=A0A1V6PZ17_9EURO|nr:hypothetical protein PENANT_c022G05831 [Penicillium antarcticum]
MGFCNLRNEAEGVVLLHDLWGIDGYSSAAEIPTPGHNGDWTSYNNFLSSIFKIFTGQNVINALDGLLSNASVVYNDRVVLNEYGNIDQQQSSGAAWNIAQMQREITVGLRAKWCGDYTFHGSLPVFWTKSLCGRTTTSTIWSIGRVVIIQSEGTTT